MESHNLSAWIVLFISSVAITPIVAKECDEPLLRRLLNTWSKSMKYVVDNESFMNLDGVVSMTMLVDQMNVLRNRIDWGNVPKDIADNIRNIQKSAEDVLKKSKSRLKKEKPEQFHQIGPVLNTGTWELNYPTRLVDRSLIDEPIKCRNINFTEKVSDQCIAEILNSSDPNAKRCQMTNSCWSYMTQYKYKDYPLTHEVLYMIVGETHGCFKELFDDEKSRHKQYLQQYLCANVLRDLEEITKLGFPTGTRDLALEQIGMCSIFGFKDFLRRDWVEATMSWQDPNGCYKSFGSPPCMDDKNQLRKLRLKRESVSLKGGCSSHMTSMGILAMAVEARFCMESEFGGKE